MNFTNLKESTFACLLLLLCCVGPIAVKSRNLGIPRVTRNDPSQDYLQLKAENPADVSVTTVEPLIATTEALFEDFNPEFTRVQEEINPITADDQPEEPDVDILSGPVASDSIPTDFQSFLEFQDVIETVSNDGEFTPELEDPSVDSRITSPMNDEAPVIDLSQSVLSDPVDFIPVHTPSVEPAASPVEPIFIAHVLPLEPIVSSPEKVEISFSNPDYYPAALMKEAFRDDALLQSYYPSSERVELRNYFPNRPFGSLPQPRELGFPPVSNTRENVMRDVNWQAKIGRAYRSS